MTGIGHSERIGVDKTGESIWACLLPWMVLRACLGGEDAVSDTFVGYLAGFAVIGGLLTALAAFVMAIVAKVKHERWALLWLPLSVFPTLLAIVVLVEALWME
jgi:hypothetical protein